jgi:hypothetical protein
MVCFEILGNIYWCSAVDEYVLGEKYISIAPNKCVLQFSVYFALKAPFVSSAKRGGDPCARLPSRTIILLRALQPDLHLLSLPISPPSPFQYPAAPLSPPLMASRGRECARSGHHQLLCHPHPHHQLLRLRNQVVTISWSVRWSSSGLLTLYN